MQQKIASFTLGVTPVSPLELANMGATLASNGIWCPPTPVAAIEDRNGNQIQWSQLPCDQAVDAKLASSLAQAMEPDIIAEYGTAHTALNAAGWGDRPAAGKTGTTEDYKSSAFLGFTPFYAGAVMVFDYENRPQPICRTPSLRTCSVEEAQGGQGMNGGSVPARTWGDAMLTLHEGKEKLDFPPASLQYQKGAGGGSVPNVVGQQFDAARAALTDKGFVVPDDYITSEPNSAAPGTVLDQSPKSSAIPGAAVGAHRLHRSRRMSGSPKARAAAVAAGLVATGVGVASYALFVEPRWFALRRVEVPVLRPGSAPIRLLHLSDLHLLPDDHRKVAWVSGLAELHPDLVVNTGDTLSHAGRCRPRWRPSVRCWSCPARSCSATTTSSRRCARARTGTS